MWNVWKKEYKQIIYQYSTVYMLQQLLALIPPYFYLLFLDGVVTKGRVMMIPMIFGGYFSVYLGEIILGYLAKKWYHKIALGAVAKWRSQMMSVIEEMAFSELKVLESGERKRMVWDDPQTAMEWVMGRLHLVLQFLGMVPAVIALLVLDFRLAIPSLCMVPVSLALTRGVRKRNSRYHQVLRDEQADYDGFMFRSLQCFKEIRADNLQEDMEKQFAGYWERMGKAFLHTHLFWFLNRTLIAFKDVFLTRMGLYLLGGILVLYGYSTVAVLLAFIDYFSNVMNTFMAMMDGYIRQGELEPSVKRVEKWLTDASAGLSKVGSEGVVKTTLEVDSDAISDWKQGGALKEIAVSNLSFSYPGNGRDSDSEADGLLLKEISLHLKTGQCLAILGKSGRGKSTLARLLVGLMQPVSGRILYNGLPLNALKEQEFFTQTGIVMQDSYLFNLSIRENLLIGNPRATEKELWKACEDTYFADFIRSLPEGMETRIGENGIRLSGGQRQRLVLARMLLHHPDVLILDEALSALDTDHEKHILQNVRAAMKQGILLVITHRRESLKNLGEYGCLEL